MSTPMDSFNFFGREDRRVPVPQHRMDTFGFKRHNRYMDFETYAATIKAIREHTWYSMVGLRGFVKALKAFGPDDSCPDLTAAQISDAIRHENCLIGGQMTGLIVGMVGAAESLLKGLCAKRMGNVPGDDSWFSHETFALVTGVRLDMLATWSHVESLWKCQRALVFGEVELSGSAGTLLEAADLMVAFGEEVVWAVKELGAL